VIPASAITALRGALVTFAGDPLVDGVAATLKHEADAIVAMAGGLIVDCGPAREVAARLPPGTAVIAHANALITAGFVDGHVHYPQIPVIGAGGKPLLEWLADYTFPMELRFSDPAFAREVARVYLAENLRHGITTAAVYGTVHPSSVDVFFEEAEARGLRMIAGKVLMDRNAPKALTDTAQRGYDESKSLLERWHGKARLGYAITPRFAVTSSPAQLEAAGALRRLHPDVHVQSHLSENTAELARVSELFPAHRRYIEVYAHFGLTGPRSIFGHGIHLGEADFQFLSDTGTALAHCPTSNNFLGSGRFNLRAAKQPGRPVRVALATDLGGGTNFSMLRTMQAACEVAQMSGFALAPSCALYLATRGSAQALGLDDRIGSIETGREADVTVLDLHSTPLIDFRMRHAQDLDEVLAIQMALGDDRAIRATYVAGKLAYERQ
jgi:guanine deaminase